MSNCATTYRNSKFDVDFVDFNRKIDNLTEKVIISDSTYCSFSVLGADEA